MHDWAWVRLGILAAEQQAQLLRSCAILWVPSCQFSLWYPHPNTGGRKESILFSAYIPPSRCFNYQSDDALNERAPCRNQDWVPSLLLLRFFGGYPDCDTSLPYRRRVNCIYILGFRSPVRTRAEENCIFNQWRNSPAGILKRRCHESELKWVWD